MSKLSAKELADITVKDIKKRKELKKKGEKEADSFLIEHKIKSNKSINKIRKRFYRGK